MSITRILSRCLRASGLNVQNGTISARQPGMFIAISRPFITPKITEKLSSIILAFSRSRALKAKEESRRLLKNLSTAAGSSGQYRKLADFPTTRTATPSHGNTMIVTYSMVKYRNSSNGGTAEIDSAVAMGEPLEATSRGEPRTSLCQQYHRGNLSGSRLLPTFDKGPQAPSVLQGRRSGLRSTYQRVSPLPYGENEKQGRDLCPACAFSISQSYPSFKGYFSATYRRSMPQE
jgi:hypothetical protein